MRQSGTFFSIGEAARLIGVVPATLRNWEKAGLIEPGRQSGNYRVYTMGNLERLKRVKYLMQVQKLNIAGVKQQLANACAEGSAAVEPVVQCGLVGNRLKALREKRCLTLEEVSVRTAVSASYLSRIELGQVNPSLMVLQKMAAFYEQTVLYFFGEPEVTGKFMPAGARKILATDEDGIRVELLSAGSGSVLESLLYTVAPGAGRNENIAHAGEEFVHVLQGCLEIWLDETERYLLQAGDSLSFASTQQHRWRNPGEAPLKVIWVNSPPTF